MSHRANAVTFRPSNRRHPIDAVTVLTIYFVIMMAVPSAARFQPAGSVGAPATMLAITVFFWWLWEQAHRSEPGPPEPQLVRRAALLLLLVMLAVYAHAALRALPPDEVAPADSALLQFIALLGLTLSATDGIPSTERLTVLLNRISLVGGLIGILAIAQFFTHRLWIDIINIPGLTMGTGDGGLGSRGAFSRPTATATHTLEFGAVAAMILPFAITRARYAIQNRALHWFLAGALLFGAVMALSRSALICTSVALLLLISRWPWTQKLRAVGAAVVVAGVMVLAAPGLLGTLRGMFLGASEDSSVQSRTDSYSYVVEMVSQFPWLGRGYGTFLPRYWILDNGYLQFLISTGFAGFLAFVGLVVSALWSARRAVRRFTKDRDRENAQALLASCAAGATSVAFFDQFSFPQAAGMLFLVIGLSGAAARLASAEQRGASPADAPLTGALGGQRG